MEVFDLVQQGDADRLYDELGSAMPKLRSLARQCIASHRQERMRLRSYPLYVFGDDASRVAGNHSLDIAATDDTLVAALMTVLPLDQPLCVAFAMGSLLDEVSKRSEMFEPHDPRDQREAMFVFEPEAGVIRVGLWVVDTLNGKRVAVREPLNAVFGAPGDQMFTRIGPYSFMPLGLTGRTPSRAVMDLVGVTRHDPEYAGVEALTKRRGGDMIADSVMDRGGVARRALALLHLTLLNEGRTTEVARRGFSRATGRSWRYTARFVPLDPHRARPETATTRTGHGTPKHRHPVRGHWRNLRRCTCQTPAWVEVRENRQTCETCGAHRTFVKSHERGTIGTAEHKPYRVVA